MTTCPRCSNTNATVFHEGRDGATLVWTLYGCPDCHFHWRDSEPEESINPAKRKSVFQMDTSDPERYHMILPVREP
ncbi:MAG: non-oxidative hydroxyarylic acid decarboxylases subunit D [Gammaproteobacteria bacterium]